MELVSGEEYAAWRVLLRQVKEDLHLPDGEVSTVEEENEVVAALGKAIPQWRSYDARLLPLAMDVVRLSGKLARACWERLAAVGRELQRGWESSKDKSICSRKFGVTSDD